jgi:hypothetical protein
MVEGYFDGFVGIRQSCDPGRQVLLDVTSKNLTPEFATLCEALPSAQSTAAG